jgi:hypothetical protein
VEAAAHSGKWAEQAPFSGVAGHHAVQFYSDDRVLCGVVADFLTDGLVANEPGVVIARPGHCEAITQELAAHGIDVKHLLRVGNLVILDAEETLARFMVDGAPDPERFSTVMGTVIERARAGRTPCVLRAYGEMVDVLWRDGKRDAAIALELLWNELAMKHSFSLLCGYATGNFYKRTSIPTICSQHTHVLPQPAIS